MRLWEQCFLWRVPESSRKAMVFHHFPPFSIISPMICPWFSHDFPMIPTHFHHIPPSFSHSITRFLWISLIWCRPFLWMLGSSTAKAKEEPPDTLGAKSLRNTWMIELLIGLATWCKQKQQRRKKNLSWCLSTCFDMFRLVLTCLDHLRNSYHLNYLLNIGIEA